MEKERGREAIKVLRATEILSRSPSSFSLPLRPLSLSPSSLDSALFPGSLVSKWRLI